MNKLVKTNAGSFYFVKRPDYIATTSQFRTNLIKGAKVQIIMHDPRYNIYVKFNSKAEVSEFLWGNRKGAAALYRYLARFENKAPVLFKKTLTFYLLNDEPKGIIPTAASAARLPESGSQTDTQIYFSLINNNRYIHK